MHLLVLGAEKHVRIGFATEARERPNTQGRASRSGCLATDGQQESAWNCQRGGRPFIRQPAGLPTAFVCSVFITVGDADKTLRVKESRLCSGMLLPTLLLIGILRRFVRW